MIKCPFCHFENEDGALFCERCTSDLATAAPAAAAALPSPPPVLPAIPVPEPLAFEAIPVATAEPLDVIPLAPVATATPIDLSPVSPTIPLALETMSPVEAPKAEPAPAMPAPEGDPLRATSPAPPQATPAPAVAPSAAPAALPQGAQPRLLVLRGQKRNVEYPLYEGLNFIGRADEKPVDIDLEEQEPPDRIWTSRQHACISFESDQLTLEDLNSANGTYVNRTRVYPGQKRTLAVNDIIQIGNVQLKVIA